MIQWNRTKHNFGKVQAGQKYSFTFEFESDDPNLKISKVKPGCQCTSTTYENQGGEGKITLTYKPNKLSKQTKDLNLDSYTSNKTAVVTFNDGSKQILKLTAQVYDKLPSKEVQA